MEVFYQVLITVIVYDILERRETRRSREGKNSMEKTNSFICCLIDWWLLISRVTRFFIEIYYCYPMNTIVTLAMVQRQICIYPASKRAIFESQIFQNGNNIILFVPSNLMGHRKFKMFDFGALLTCCCFIFTI